MTTPRQFPSDPRLTVALTTVSPWTSVVIGEVTTKFIMFLCKIIHLEYIEKQNPLKIKGHSGESSRGAKGSVGGVARRNERKIVFFDNGSLIFTYLTS